MWPRDSEYVALLNDQEEESFVLEPSAAPACVWVGVYTGVRVGWVCVCMCVGV